MMVFSPKTGLKIPVSHIMDMPFVNILPGMALTLVFAFSVYPQPDLSNRVTRKEIY
jgi:hypothetical protein